MIARVTHQPIPLTAVVGLRESPARTLALTGDRHQPNGHQPEASGGKQGEEGDKPPDSGKKTGRAKTVHPRATVGRLVFREVSYLAKLTYHGTQRRGVEQSGSSSGS